MGEGQGNEKSMELNLEQAGGCETSKATCPSGKMGRVKFSTWPGKRRRCSILGLGKVEVRGDFGPVGSDQTAPALVGRDSASIRNPGSMGIRESALATKIILNY
jgi:hypothetical protein